MNRDRLSHFAYEMDFQNQKLLTCTERIWGKGHEKTAVYMWYKRFEEGRENIKDDQHSGRPRVVTSSHVAAVKHLLDNDRRITIRDIVAKTDYSYGTVSGIIHNQLNMRRICARWIPEMLNTDQKRLRVECCEQLLKRFEREGEKVHGQNCHR